MPRFKPRSSDSQVPLKAERSPPRRVIIGIVWQNDKEYTAVDITNCENGQAIRERILFDLDLLNDPNSSFDIFRDVPGVHADNTPLCDADLFLDCRDYGDAKCSLFFHIDSAETPFSDTDDPVYSPPRATRNEIEHITSRHTRRPSSSSSVHHLPSRRWSSASGVSNTSRASFDSQDRDSRDPKSEELNSEGLTSEGPESDGREPEDSDSQSELSASDSESENDFSLLETHALQGRIKSTSPPPSTGSAVKISSTMLSSTQIIKILSQYRCQVITAELQLESCSKYPIANGGFGDVYRGRLNRGTRVAIKCVRIFDYPDDGEQQRKDLKASVDKVSGDQAH
ncbi:hypothetical protein FRC07_007656 [Ceratobasidium sp. 392]|nr:hypothetical protein FRC07_007656 [Ceratobasidium sp. 392]